uniref:Uncharacterized protein n=1 Tax=Meloidogyne enterolobii TaxID=390850 RepID=A0A6V7VBZ8_MELEN|nr:unnamed protein product [Meloidogyne enterolobii]
MYMYQGWAYFAISRFASFAFSHFLARKVSHFAFRFLVQMRNLFRLFHEVNHLHLN